MKKKVISGIVALVMLISMSFASVSAAADFSNENPVKFEILAEEISNDDYKGVMETDIPTGYGAYAVSINMSNYGLLNGSITKKATGAQGTGDTLADFTVKMKTSEEANVYSADGAYYILDMGSQFPFTTIGYDGTYFNINAQAGSAIEAFPMSTLTPPTVMNKTVTTGDLSEKVEALGYLWIVAKPGTQFSVITNGTFSTYSANNIDSSKDKSFYTATGYDGISAEAKGTAVITETVTLGTSVPVVKEEVVAGTGAVAGNNATEGKYDGKYLKHIATILEDTALSKYVSISDGTETKVSTRTVAEILGGISVNNTSVSGKLAIGVLTDNENAVFTFKLVAPAAE